MSVHVESVGRGRALVMLHGWGMHCGLWFPFLPRLIERTPVSSTCRVGYSDALLTPPPLSLRRVVSGGARDRRNADASSADDLGWSLGQVAL